MATESESPTQPQNAESEPQGKALDFIRGIVRPVVTLVLIGAFTAAYLRVMWKVQLNADVYVGIAVGFTNLVSAAAGFWFGQRNR